MILRSVRIAAKPLRLTTLHFTFLASPFARLSVTAFFAATAGCSPGIVVPPGADGGHESGTVTSDAHETGTPSDATRDVGRSDAPRPRDGGDTADGTPITGGEDARDSVAPRDAPLLTASDAAADGPALDGAMDASGDAAHDAGHDAPGLMPSDAGTDAAVDAHRPTFPDATAAIEACETCLTTTCGADVTECLNDPTCKEVITCAVSSGCLAADGGSVEGCVDTCISGAGITGSAKINLIKEITALSQCASPCVSKCGAMDGSAP
jgi:hypothetical protein